MNSQTSFHPEIVMRFKNLPEPSRRLVERSSVVRRGLHDDKAS